ncbi:MAG TPA: class I adenylate-forming enzyme family protein [Desertimonas sp.]|nr:class I adenylate-forming enzyme family protein [Desertimonas sp.]
MTDPTHAQTFPALFADIVRERADHPALITADETLAYAELERRSARMARALLASGAGKGTRLALLAPDSALFLTTFYAALRIGALVTPISTLTTPPELAHVVRTSDAQILVGARRVLRRNFGQNLEVALPGLADARSGSLWLSSAPHLRSVWLDDAEGLGWARPVDDLLARADCGDGPDDELLAAVEREVSPADDAFVVYTSGSTATPKAVVHDQRAVVTKPQALAPIFLMTSDDRTMPLLPAFWLGGIAAALQVLCTGSTLVYPPSPDIDDVLDMIERHDVTYVVVWHTLAKLRAAGIERGIDVDRIRGLGRPRDEDGEPIPGSLRANLLGMSESFAVHSGEPIDVRMPDDKRGASGRAVNGIERRVVDPDTGLEIPPGEVGELQLRGGGLMSGFYKVERDEVFTPDGFYPTKDLVRIDADGYAWFVGRTGDMIKTSSANVSRLEVEAALAKLPEVELPLVAGLPDPEVGEIVAAAVVPAAGTAPTEDGLRAALRDRLSGFKIPRRIVFITDDDVPRTATGKLRLADVAQLVEVRLGGRTSAASPTARPTGDPSHG